MNRSLIERAGMGKATIRSYVTGFLLAGILTSVSFALVMRDAMSRRALLAVIFSAAALQSLVHIHYFLHLDMSSESRWNVMALVFTVVLMIIFIGGSIWIMFDLYSRMM